MASQRPGLPTEYELKLRLDPERLARLERALESHGASRSAPGRLVSTYYDTPDGWLADHTLSLRVRAADDLRIQTVKADLDRGQGYARAEWETVLCDDRLDLDAVPDRRVRGLLQRARDERSLEPLFVTDFQRTRCRLERGGQAEIECAIDVGEIRSGDRVEPICEVELELRSGSRAELFGLARELRDEVAFALESRSKAARGHALRGTPVAAPHALRPRLDAAWTVERAFKEIASRDVAHWRAHEAVAISGTDPLGVHQMRVAVRRLRSSVSLLKRELPAELTGRLSGELRWCARRLAAARDWDVFLGQTLPPLRESLPREPALDVLERRARKARDSAYTKVRRTLDSARYTRTLLDWGLWLEADDWSERAVDLDGARLAVPILETARDLLEAQHEAVTEAGARIAELGSKELHELRLRVKRLRYATEALGSLYPRDRTRRYFRSLQAVQEQLGRLQDAAVRPALLRGLRRDAGRRADRKALVRAEGIVTGWQSAASGETRRLLRKAWVRFERRAPFWRA